VTKLVSRLRYININYGKVFGGFLDDLSKAFDSKSSSDIEQEVRNSYKSKEEQKEILIAIQHYKNNLAFNEIFGNGDKAKFNHYAVDLPFLGKVFKDWKSSALNSNPELYSSSGGSSSSSRRILAQTRFKEAEEGINWS
jgi:hypothetical protein